MEICIVSGASGLVGRELADVFVASGRPVRAWQRSPAEARANVEHARMELGVTPGADVARALAGAGVFVHAAWDLDAATWPEIERLNVRGSIAWFEAAARAGVGKLVFVSSVSAYPGCRSMYGRSKLLVEDAVARLGGVTVRPGVVCGDASRGVFGRLWNSTDAAWIPLIDGGRQNLLTVHRRDLACAIEHIVSDYERWRGRVVAVGHPQLVTLRDMLERMARVRGRTPRFVPVPGGLVMLGLRSAEAVGLRLRFRSDSLLTLQGPDPVVEQKLLGELGVSFRSLDDALASSLPQ